MKIDIKEKTEIKLKELSIEMNMTPTALIHYLIECIEVESPVQKKIRVEAPRKTLVRRDKIIKRWDSSND